MTQKRTINGTRYNIPEIVDEAMAIVAGMTLDPEQNRETLRLMGYTNLSDEFLARYARDKAILAALGRLTGANFAGQIGKINFDGRESAISGVESYLNRRIAGQHARWTERRGR